MKIKLCIALLICCTFAYAAYAAASPKTISLGHWTTVKWVTGERTEDTVEIRVRPLLVDNITVEFTMGETHEVTEHQYVVRRIVKLNDALSSESGPLWRWQPAGWLLVDTASGRINKLTLPDFDPYYSSVSWYRDMAAYCGFDESGDRTYAVVAQ